MPLSPIPNNHKTLIYGTREEAATFGLLAKNSTNENITFTDSHSTWDNNYERIYLLPSISNSINASKLPYLCIGKLNKDGIGIIICDPHLVLPNTYYAELGMKFEGSVTFEGQTYNRINFAITKKERSDEDTEKFSWRHLVEVKAAEQTKGNRHIM